MTSKGTRSTALHPCDQADPSQLQPGTREPFCAEQQGWPGAAGQPRIICPGCTRGCLFPGPEGEASARHPVSVLLRLSGKPHHPVMGTGHAGPTPVGSAPGAHVGAISPAGILVDTSRFFLYSRAVAQRGGEGGGVMGRLRLLRGKGCIPES